MKKAMSVNVCNEQVTGHVAQATHQHVYSLQGIYNATCPVTFQDLPLYPDLLLPITDAKQL